MSKRKKDILSIKDDVEFLQAYLKKLQSNHEAICYHLSPEDFQISGDNLPVTTPEAERTARLADDYNEDGSLFRNLISEPLQDFEEFRRNFRWWSREQAKRLEKQIKIIPRIIAKIEKAVETKRDETDEPKDLIDLTKALTHVHISRSQIKRHIRDGKIKSYRKNPKGKHFVSLAEVQKLYMAK